MEADAEPTPPLTMEERLQLMRSNPQRRKRGQVPMELVQQAREFQRSYVAHSADFNVSAVSDCSESLAKLRNDKREAREQREMTWEDHVATAIRDEATRTAATKAKKLAQETAMLAQLKTDKDKWNMAVELKLSEYLQSTLPVADASVRGEFLTARKGASGQSPLHRAVYRAKDVKLIALLLDCEADLTARDDLGRTAFQLAVETGKIEVLQLLLTRVSSGNQSTLLQTNNAGFSLLHTAAMHGHHDILQLILQTLPTVKVLSLLNLQTSKHRMTALHLAAQNGHERCLRLLLETKGTRTDLLNTAGSNALHLALRQTFNINNLVRAFVDGRANIGSGDDTFDCIDDVTGHSCLHTAILKNFRHAALALLKTKRVALNSSTRDGGWSALHLAVMTEEIVLVNALLEAGAMVDSVDNDGQTALLLACLGGQLDIMRVLLESGANPAQLNIQGHSPLHYLAAFCRDRELLVDLIARGADVNAKTLKLNTPMHFAAMNGNEVATRVLLEHGASASAINEDKRSVLYLAKKWRHRVVEGLVKPPEERETPDSRAMTADNHAHGFSRTPQFGGARRAVPFTTSGGGHSRSSTPSRRTRTPLTTRSEDSDADSVYSFDDEEILEPSTPWPTGLRTASQGGNNGSSSLTRRPPCRSFGELRRLFVASPGPQSTPDTTPLKPVMLAHQLEHHAAEMQAARALLEAPATPQFTKFTRRLLTGPVHFPWEMTVPTLDTGVSSSSDSALQRKLKPSVRTHIGLLRDHLTHAQHLNWPRYANQRVFRKEDQFP